MPQIHKLAAARIALTGVGENLIRLEIQESQAHGAIAHDAFQMTNSSATAITLLGVESDNCMSTFPNPVGVRPAAVTNSIAECPDANKSIQMSTRSGQTRGDGIGVVQDVNGRLDALSRQHLSQSVGQTDAFDLLQVGRIFDDAIANNAGNGDPDGSHWFLA